MLHFYSDRRTLIPDLMNAEAQAHKMCDTSLGVCHWLFR